MDKFDPKLIRKILQGKASNEELVAFNEWYEQVPEVKTELIFNEGFSEKELEQKLWIKINPYLSANALKKKNSIFTFKTWKIAASWILFLALFSSVYFIFSQKDQSNDLGQIAWKYFENGSSGIKKILLPDGSQVRLNKGSELWISPNFKSNREVKLNGEGFFDVQRDSLHPFKVYTQNLVTEVLGTSFLVQSEKSAFESVQVKSGKVSVRLQGEFSYLLSPGNRIEWKNSQLNFIEDGGESSYDWVEGLLRFENESITQVISKLESWYGVKIHLENNLNLVCHLTGTYQNLSLENVLELISFSIPIEYSIDNQVVNIHLKSCH
ncbi:FecR family protein [Algoriphagus sp. NBT04N3]|jgi:transmembrane sensor|uniref:FecR family protein n=1 Tax=Algoriphagus sp. NBT04N3 TaxID=2705473 RepID=UPI001C637005|nr:FecR family protein [Algoriphagus sp. NBT04N3]QYH38946.1 FecR family protein [Algoriphagus sp. NBT04N3]